MTSNENMQSPGPQGIISSVTREGQFLVRAVVDQKMHDSDAENELDKRFDDTLDDFKMGVEVTYQAPSRLDSRTKLKPARPPVSIRLRRFLHCFCPQSKEHPAKQMKPVKVISPENLFVLPPMSEDDSRAGLKTLILDLDETLVHSSFTPVSNADFIVPVEIERVRHQVYVCKRPHVDTFLKEIGPMFETVIFTASLSKYADPVVDLLDPSRVVDARLFREHCVEHCGNFVKDLDVLGRDLGRTVIIDNAPDAYAFHPQNALPCSSWFDDPNDRELLDLIPLLKQLASSDDVRVFLETSLAHGELPLASLPPLA